jgi:hypothetical protein
MRQSYRLVMTLRVGFAIVVAAAAFPGAARAGCPGALQPLASPPTAAERGAATKVAVRYARLRYAPRAGLLTLRMGATDVRWTRDWADGRFLLSACGRAAWTRTLAVTVVFPVMYDDPPRPFPGCSFCAGVVLLVSRGPAGWFVWDAL